MERFYDEDNDFLEDFGEGFIVIDRDVDNSDEEYERAFEMEEIKNNKKRSEKYNPLNKLELKKNELDYIMTEYERWKKDLK